MARRFPVVLLGVLLTLGNSCSTSTGPSKMNSPREFLSWVESNRDSVGLVVTETGSTEPHISLNPEKAFPLASTRKVLILGAYAVKVADGSLDPMQPVSVEDVERWYWQGTDGGAHEMAKKEWVQQGKINGSVGLALDDVVHAMIRWSDNAAADYVLDRVGGRNAVAEFAKRVGMKSQGPLMPIFGEFIAWSTEDVDEWSKFEADARARRAEELAEKTPPSALEDLKLPTVSAQFEFAKTGTAGVPREWASLMSSLHEGSLPVEAIDVTRRHLEWPLQAFPSNRQKFESFGAKGGSLPGVLTEAMYIEPKGSKAWSVAMFMRDVPAKDWRPLVQSFVHQRFILGLIEDDELRDEAKQALSE